MRVLYYCPEYYSNHGARTHAREFFDALRKDPRVSDAWVIAPAVDMQMVSDALVSTVDELQARGSSTSGKWRRIFRFLRPKIKLTDRVISAAREMSCDMLIVRTGVRNLLHGRIRRNLPGVTICLEINSAYFDEAFSAFPLRRILQRWEVSRFKPAHAVSVVSSSLRDYLVERGYPSHRILINHNGVNPAQFQPSVVVEAARSILEQIPPDSYVLGYIGGMELFRKLPLLVRHVANLRRQGMEKLFLLMVGGGKDEGAVKNEITVQSDALAGAVLTTGWVSHDVVPALLRRVNLAVFPYTNPYCSPLKLFEYLGAGVPCIGPDTSAVRDVFEEREHLLLAAQDGSNFEALVREVYNSPQQARDMADRGRTFVLSHYTWAQNVDRLLNHICQVMI